MSTKPAKQATPIVPPLTLKELGEVLVKHYNLKEGRYEVLVEFMIGMGSVGPTPESRLPGAMLGLNKIGLVKVDHDGPLTINAADLQTTTE
ncbi:MAG: hypothetical protein U9P36_09700 [Thermodesulfobacteriota bacterium]|nr:hypothetical protein [Thermodesulfobacteriota bacterium]